VGELVTFPRSAFPRTTISGPLIVRSIGDRHVRSCMTATCVVVESHAPAVAAQLAKLRALQAEHPFWSNPLLVGFARGAYSRDDLRYIYSQYHLYSKNFTRFIAGAMANCDSDLFRAQLSENLWDEGGGCEPERRHAQLFRDFLAGSLGITEPDKIEFAPYTRHFVREYLVYCLRSEPMSGAAFLSLGTEGIVSRMYQTMLVGLRAAVIPEDQLEFFHLHISCDDDHAITLENMMASYANEPGWFDACVAAMNRALELRDEFFRNIFDALHARRLDPILARMQAHDSLARGVPDAKLVHRPGAGAVELYANEVEKLNVKFTVDRLPLQCEVLDPRMVRIPAGKYNEKHKHAHETLIHILEGTGNVLVDDRVLDVKPGDSILVPRWAMHQTRNTGATEMRFLAVTDFRLTERAYVGDATAYRLNADADALAKRRR
jgi:quercetin dioxygenase-like cupin family protein/pyrroloquinoline quinone (PQQ) biosynthesis protein C